MKGEIEMSEKQKLLMNATFEMTDYQIDEILNFVRFIQFKYDAVPIPERLIVKNEEELAKKIKKGLKDIKNDKVYTFDDMINQTKSILES